MPVNALIHLTVVALVLFCFFVERYTKCMIQATHNKYNAFGQIKKNCCNISVDHFIILLINIIELFFQN